MPFYLNWQNVAKGKAVSFFHVSPLSSFPHSTGIAIFFFNDDVGFLVGVFQGRGVAGANVVDSKLTHSNRATIIIFCVTSLIPSLSNRKPTIFLHSLFLENKAQIQFKKYQGNAVTFKSMGKIWASFEQKLKLAEICCSLGFCTSSSVVNDKAPSAAMCESIQWSFWDKIKDLFRLH